MTQPHRVGATEGEFVCIRWPDDAKLPVTVLARMRLVKRHRSCHARVHSRSRRPTDEIEVKSAVVDNAGDLIVEWGHDGHGRFITRGGYVMLRKITTDPVAGCQRRSRGRQARLVNCLALTVRLLWKATKRFSRSSIT